MQPAPGSTPVGRILPALRTSLFSAVISVDVYIMHAVQGARARLPRSVRRTLDKLLSAHPLYDVTLGLWLLVPWALALLGWRLFWALALNVTFAFLATWYIGGPLPGEWIGWLRPRARLSPSGFPCIELQVASCLLTYVAWWYGPRLAVVLPCAAALAALVALRLYALSHFPHQLLLSAAIGAASVSGCRKLGRYMFALPVPQEVHLLGAFAVACLFLGYICYYAETNEVPFGRISQAECAWGALAHHSFPFPFGAAACSLPSQSHDPAPAAFSSPPSLLQSPACWMASWSAASA